MEFLVSSKAIDFEVTNFDTHSLLEPRLSPVEIDLHMSLAREILSQILQFRRTPNLHSKCNATCVTCQSHHLTKVYSAIQARKPITFILPAFPGKSPNPAKVFGPLPDMAEKLALQFLAQLCNRIKEIYAPGAQIILCSDGRVFSDIVGMRETDVTEYQNELKKMIEELGLTTISTFNLDELCDSKGFIQMRRELMEGFGGTLESLRKKVMRGSKQLGNSEDEDAHRMYCGITRFLVEDSTFPGQTKTRTAVQKECKAKAYELIRRSNAWSELISKRFPEAVRLSIHPQSCGSKKLGIRLVGTESWMTPWHGVAVKVNEDFILHKRTDAEAMGAKLIYSKCNRPSHFELLNTSRYVNEIQDN